MSTQPDVKRIIQQTEQYEFADGLRELQLAVMMVASGVMAWFVFDLMGWWMPILVEWMHSVGKWMGWSIQMVVLLPALAALVMLLVMRFVRRRWLWRETGVVKPNRRIVPLRVTLISLAITLAGLGIGVIIQLLTPMDNMFLLKMLFIASGWSFGYTLYAMGNRVDLPRLRRVGLFGVIVPTIPLILPLSVGLVVLLWGVIWGAALGISGTGALRQKVQAAQKGVS